MFFISIYWGYSILSFLSLILCVPFLIWSERRILGNLQVRKGVFLYFLNGFWVFIADFLKILSKKLTSFISPTSGNLILTCLVFTIYTIVLLRSQVVAGGYSWISFLNNWIIIVGVFSFIPFPFINLVNISNSIYAYIGVIRIILVLISVELGFFFSLFLGLWILTLNYKFKSFFHLISSFIILISLILSFIIEAGRLPVDLTEAESEIVSGFNTELSTFYFLLVFFGEYIIFFSLIVIISILSSLNLIFLIFFLIFLRGLCIRIRYVNIIWVSWFGILLILTVQFFYILNFVI